MKVATYAVRAYCDNCHFKGRVSITRGTLVNRKACPECGCAKLRVLDRPLDFSAIGRAMKDIVEGDPGWRS